MKVVRESNEPLENLLRRFKKASASVLTDAKRHTHAVSKGQRRRKKRSAAIRRKASRTQGGNYH